MFALAGYISKTLPDGKVIRNMLDGISNFDGQIQEYRHGNCVLGQKQLSDRFNDGRIQYSSIDGLAIVFSGKIYNKTEIIEESGITSEGYDDGEAVLSGYKTFGKDIVKRLQGMFAFAIYDEAKEELIIARDGCGMRQIYYYTDSEKLVFATGTRAFEGFDGFKKELNEDILSAFLCFGSVPTKETLIKNVFRLEPGYILSYKNGNVSKECFFRLQFNEKSRDLDEVTEEIHQAVVSSVKRHTADGNFATFLSGGVDSSYIASVAMPKITYTAGYSDQKYDESVYTKELAEKLGIENRVKTVTPEEYLEAYADIVRTMDEPLSNPSVPSIYFGASEAAKAADIIISGEGADELFGGYNSYKEETSHSGYMKLPYSIRHLAYILTCWIPGSKFDFFARRGQKLRDYHIGLDRVFKDKDAEKILKISNQVHTKSVTAEYYDTYKDCSTMKQRQAIDFYFWLINDFVHCVARSADRFGIESRFPLLGKEIIDIATSLPDEYKLGNGTTKLAFRNAAKKAVPTDAHSRKKLGFPVPLKEWIKRDDFYNEIKSKFRSETAEKFFNVRAILNMLEDHKNGKADCYKKVWTVYTFIVWYDLNFND